MRLGTLASLAMPAGGVANSLVSGARTKGQYTTVPSGANVIVSDSGQLITTPPY